MKSVDPEIAAKILTDYNGALAVIHWLCQNDRISGISSKFPGERRKMRELAREFATGPGPAATNFRRAIFDGLISLGD